MYYRYSVLYSTPICSSVYYISIEHFWPLCALKIIMTWWLFSSYDMLVLKDVWTQEEDISTPFQDEEVVGSHCMLKLSMATFSMMYWLPSSGGLTIAWTLQFEERIPNFRKYRPPLPCPSKSHTSPVKLMRPGIGQDASYMYSGWCCITSIKGDVVCWLLMHTLTN